MRALRVVRPGELAVETVPDPVPGPGEVLLAVEACGVCGSDLHLLQMDTVAPGQILGHEFSGRVLATGSQVRDWRPGDRAAVNPVGQCGRCRWCQSGMGFLCAEYPNLGINAPGGFAELAVVPVEQLYRLPEAVSFEVGALIEPLAVAWRAVAVGRPRPDDRVLVTGAGMVGLCTTVALRAHGVQAITVVERAENRRQVASALGARKVLGDFTDLARYAGPTSDRFDIAWECSGAPDALSWLTRTVRPGGTLVQVALTGSMPKAAIWDFVNNGQALLASCAYDRDVYRQAYEWAIAHPDALQPLLVHRKVGLSEAPDAFEWVRHPEAVVGAVVEPQR
ncbi:MAG: alcohol dehydrogenase catalytic domain-containing protein [Firmicutes bacterium]|nr:alcohol dehydrogenase catalytic domain-containing protein [Alicyclobacillaceae bacterium]MCL6496224.1 alcohol dehydrogenase catalytic domain-containing protein [Bacillota bacterium]